MDVGATMSRCNDERTSLTESGGVMSVDLGSGKREIEAVVKDEVANGVTDYGCKTITTPVT